MVAVVGIGNRVVMAVLRSRAHRVLSGSVAIVSYRGRRSGDLVSLPVQYAGDADRLVVGVGYPASKRWWHNFDRGHPAEVRLAGRTVAMNGRAVISPVDGDEDLEAYRARFPRQVDLGVLVVFTPVVASFDPPPRRRADD